MNNYSFSEFSKNVYSLVMTKVFYPQMRFVRRPIYMRGKSSLSGGKGLTTGHFCRFDLLGNRYKTLFIGENCEIGDNVHIVARQKVTIGDNVLIASKVFISDTNHGRYDNEDTESSPFTHPNNRELFTAPVSIGNNVWIGENVVILSGVTIGDGCIIGANSVVKNDLQSGVIAVGSPAKVVKYYDYNEKKWCKKI